MKTELVNSNALAFSRFDLIFRLAVDTGSQGIGFMFYKIHENDLPKVVRFGSKGLSSWQQPYGPPKLELLGVVTSVTDCVSYLSGHHFIVECDHQNDLFFPYVPETPTNIKLITPDHKVLETFPRVSYVQVHRDKEDMYDAVTEDDEVPYRLPGKRVRHVRNVFVQPHSQTMFPLKPVENCKILPTKSKHNSHESIPVHNRQRSIPVHNRQ